MKSTKLLLLGSVLMSGIFVSGSFAWGQSTEAAVEARLKDKPLYLRGRWEGKNLSFDGAGIPDKVYPVASFTISGFEESKVHLSGDHLRVEGQRMALVFDDVGGLVLDGNGLPPRANLYKLTIDIDGHGSMDFTKALDAVFADGLDEMKPSLPVEWSYMVARNFVDFAIKGAAKPPLADNGSSIPSQNGGPKIMHVGGTVKPPVLLYSVDPAFTSEARQKKRSAIVRVYLWLGTDGKPTHLRIVNAAGYGLDERAVGAVEQYRFKPATKDGTSVPVDLYIDVNFKIF